MVEIIPAEFVYLITRNIDMQERKLDKLFLARLKWQRLFKSCQPLFKIERLCMSSTPVVLHAGLNNQLQQMQLNKTIRNEENQRQ